MSRRPSSPSPDALPGSVRIIGGRWRGTKLEVPAAPGLRPTGDRVRETVFNWLQPVLPGARVLDLFAGSGVLGLEAVSRGAREAVLVERDPALAEGLRGAVERLRAADQVRVVRADAIAWLRAPLAGRFDVVFLDPPFAAGLWPQAFAALPAWLAEDAWLYVEAPAEAAVGTGAAAAIDPGGGFRLHREGRTRQTRYMLYRRVRPGSGAATLAAAPTAHGDIPDA